MEQERVRFLLRKDMPRGFRENTEYPELPAILNYLLRYDGQEFNNAQEFEAQVLRGFLDYLESEGVLVGKDPKLRQGLSITPIEDRFQTTAGDWWDYSVFTPANNGPGKCVFGGLELLNLK